MIMKLTEAEKGKILFFAKFQPLLISTYTLNNRDFDDFTYGQIQAWIATCEQRFNELDEVKEEQTEKETVTLDVTSNEYILQNRTTEYNYTVVKSYAQKYSDFQRAIETLIKCLW